MARRPSSWLIYGKRVIDEVAAKAPQHVKEQLVGLLEALAHGPYPHDNMLHCVPAKGFGYPNCFIAFTDEVRVMYIVMKDQPVVSLVGVRWGNDLAEDVWTVLEAYPPPSKI